MREGLVIDKVFPGGIANQMGVEPGDRIVRINGQPIRDILDYKFLIADEKIKITLIKTGGKSWLLDIEKNFEDNLGLEFNFNELGYIMRCKNKCIFCFLAQMPPGMRETLYFNDDDYRLSFTRGNFITLTNTARRDLRRIVSQHLSPLYISVHTTNPALRVKMLNNQQAGKIMKQLTYLARAGIQMHTQIVLCPKINDGPELGRTISDLGDLWPAVCSLAVVPVGLTRFRNGLASLRAYSPPEAGQIIREVEKWQSIYLRRWGEPFVYAGDEFYVLADIPVPPAKNYAYFPQLENGVGLVRLFLDEWNKVLKKLPSALEKPRKATIVTGRSAERILKPVVKRLNEIENLEVQLVGVDNIFFGGQVNVAGLLTSGDILRALMHLNFGELLIVPAATLHEEKQVFLDGMSVEELGRRLGVKVAEANGPDDLYSLLINGKRSNSDVSRHC